MPELPEVETVRQSLLCHIVGRRIIAVTTSDFPGVLGGADPQAVDAALSGLTIMDIRRRGKYLIFDLDDGSTLIIHLRMTGQLTHTPHAAPPGRFEHLAIELDSAVDLRFGDQRKFGRVIHASREDALRLSARLGPEPLSKTFTATRLQERLAHRGAPIKSVLLGQRVIAGLGNIYADEALFRARLHPLRSSASLSSEEIRRLHRAIRVVLREGLEHRGTSISTFRDGAGQEGRNQLNLRVYGRGRRGEPCPRCGQPLSCLVIGGRSSHFCSHCQPPPGDTIMEDRTG
jgi:formamidopyrimidine-DNA glycosylase